MDLKQFNLEVLAGQWRGGGGGVGGGGKENNIYPNKKMSYQIS